jgi:hypothetical protein
VRESNHSTICVGATVGSDLPFSRETMHALPDPADSAQAVLQNVPFFVDGLNFGDLVRIGERDDIGVHPIEAVVQPGGHVRVLLFLEDQPVAALFERMAHLFPDCALRMENGGDGLVAISMHPDLDPEDVFEALLDWVAEHVPEDEDHWDNTAFCISEPIHTTVGPLRARLPRF